jgi:hypothetical protein
MNRPDLTKFCVGQGRLMVFSLTGTISLVQPRQKFDSLPCFLFVVFGFELKGGRLAGSRVPLATIFSRPFEYVEVFGKRGFFARARVPRASLFTEPLHESYVTTYCGL